MKKIVLLSVLVCLLAGCKAMDSLVFHPLHVVHEQHEYNEAQEKAKEQK